jgi:CRISPR-associated endonuclease Cas1
MRPEIIDPAAEWPAEESPRNGVLVLSGYGLSIRVWRGRLRVEDGIGRTRREAVIHRAFGRLRRLVVLGHTGSISLEAIRWLSDVGAGYVQIDADGRVLAAFGPLGTDRPGLRRAQARALDTPIGDAIARRLIGEKIEDQAKTLSEVARVVGVGDTIAGAIREASMRLHVATSRDEIRQAESLAAATYWGAWSPVPVRWARRDADEVPVHWRTFGSRTSPLTASPRLAANPANAMLNYLYAILEGEATLAARVVGLDPGLGVLHADQLNRNSLSADLMEPVRPFVDRYVLELLSRRSLAAADFFETRQGVCRLTPGLASELAKTLPSWRLAVGRVAEAVAAEFEGRDGEGRYLPTPITGRNRSRGRGEHRKANLQPGSAHVEIACISCGRPTAPDRQTCSSECAEEARAFGAEAFIASGRRALADLRATGWKPVHDGQTRARIGRRTSDLVTAARAWQRANRWPTDHDRFSREIQPRLGSVPVVTLVAATGLSAAYCRRIKRGEVVPHPMWWVAIAATAPADGVDPDPSMARSLASQ